MRMEENTLIIDEPILEDKLEEFEASVNQSQIEKIIIEEENLHASAIQILWCLDKEVDIKSEFLKKFFENVKVND